MHIRYQWNTIIHGKVSHLPWSKNLITWKMPNSHPHFLKWFKDKTLKSPSSLPYAKESNSCSPLPLPPLQTKSTLISRTIHASSDQVWTIACTLSIWSKFDWGDDARTLRYKSLTYRVLLITNWHKGWREIINVWWENGFSSTRSYLRYVLGLSTSYMSSIPPQNKHLRV